MRHSYVGDVGDYGKYGLLRTLVGDGQEVRLGVVWYLTDATENNNDGKHDGYLKRGSKRQREAFERCDPPLYARMKAIREQQRLNIAMVQDGSVLPQNTIFYGTPVPRATIGGDYEAAWKQRDDWHSRSLDTMSSVDCVLIDPDNGVEFSKREDFRRLKPSRKHSYWHEITDYLSGKKSIVAYHHLNRDCPHRVQIDQCLAHIQAAGSTAWAIHYRRGTGRAFFVIPGSRECRRVLREGSEEFARVWQQHAALIDP